MNALCKVLIDVSSREGLLFTLFMRQNMTKGTNFIIVEKQNKTNNENVCGKLKICAKSNFLLVTPTPTSEEVKSGLDVSTKRRGGRIALKYIQIHHNFTSADFVM